MYSEIVPNSFVTTTPKNKNFVSDQIKEFSKTNINENKFERNIIRADEKAMVEAKKNSSLNEC